MTSGDIIRVTTHAVPKGIVPDKYVKLLYKYQADKWYGIKSDSRDFTATLDSRQVFILEPEL